MKSINPRRIILAALLAVILAFGTSRAGAQTIGFTANAFTGDADSGISTGNTYTITANIIGSDVAINGVTFTGSGVATSGTNWSLTGVPSRFDSGGVHQLGGSAVSGLFDGFQYNGNPGVMTLSGLTVGHAYTTTFYNQAWEFPGTRQVNVTAGTDSISYNQDMAAGSLLSYTFVASATTQAINFAPVVPGTTFHFYGFSNQDQLSNTLTLAAGGTLTLNESSTTTNPLYLSGAGTQTIVVPHGNNPTLTGGVTTDGSTGTLVIDGASLASASHNLTFSGGTMALGAKSFLVQGNADANPGNQTTTLSNVTLTTSGDVGVGRANLVIGGTSNVTVGGVIGGSPMSPSADWGYLTIKDSAAVTATNGIFGNTTAWGLNLLGGTLTTKSIQASDFSYLGAYLYFNGTTVKANQDNAAFVTIQPGGGGKAYIGSGGALIDSDGFNIGIGVVLANGSSAPTSYNGDSGTTVAGTGSLTKSGAGTLTLSGANTYTGATAVNTGKLIGVTGGSCSNSAITVASGATNGVLVATAGGQWACGALTYSSGTTYADFNFGANAPGATAPLLVNGNLTLTGTTLEIIVRSSAGITNGVYPLLKYTGTLAGTPPTAAFSLPAAWGGSISNDTANKSLVLVVTNGTVMQWAVGNEVWDINTTGNWKDTDGTTGLKYFDGNTVTFDDTASGTSPIYVTNNSTVTPGSLTINNTTKAYVITGNGNISGSTALVKTGSGGSSLTLGGTNTFSGGTINSGGTLKLDSDFALGTGSLTVQSGAGNPTVILDLNGHTVTNTIATTGGDCYVRNTSANAATLSGPVTIGSYTRLGFYGDTTYGSVGSMTLSGIYSGGWYDKQGASLLALTGTNTYAGSTIINGGVVRAVDGVGITTANLVINDASSVGAVFESASGGNLVRALGSGANQVQLNNGSCGFSAYGAAATVSLGGLGTPASLVWGSAYFYPSSLVLNYYSANTNLTLANAINLNGTNRTISVYASVATIAGVISNSTGTAGITKLGAGTLVLTNASTYTGNTVISAGTLALSGSGSIVSTPQITVAGSAIFDVSGLSSTFTLGSARTLSNSASATGTLNGNLNASAGTNSVSYVSGTPAFTVTNGTLTLSGSTVFKVNNTGAQLAHGTHKIISKATSGNVGLVAGSLPAVTVSGGGAAAPVSLQLVNGELYLNVNTAPVAQNISMGAQVGVLQTLPILTGKHAAFDSDSDTLTISAVTSGTNGGVVVISGGNVTYSNNVIGSDSFTYTVNDGYGGTDTKTVLVSVSNVINQQASITYSGGTVSLTFWGVPGTSYTIQRATDVNGPWTDLSTVVANTSQPIGQVSLSDTPPANGSYFYRLKP